MNAEIKVIEHEAIEIRVVAVWRHYVRDESQERLFSCCSNWTDSIIVIFAPDRIAYVPDCRFDLRRKKSNAKLACRNNGNGK